MKIKSNHKNFVYIDGLYTYYTLCILHTVHITHCAYYTLYILHTVHILPKYCYLCQSFKLTTPWKVPKNQTWKIKILKNASKNESLYWISCLFNITTQTTLASKGQWMTCPFMSQRSCTFLSAYRLDYSPHIFVLLRSGVDRRFVCSEKQLLLPKCLFN